MVLKFSQRRKPFYALQSILSLFNLEIILTLINEIRPNFHGYWDKES